MQAVYIAGVGMTKFGKDPRPLAEIFCQVSQQALTDPNSRSRRTLYRRHESRGIYRRQQHRVADCRRAGLTGVPALRVENRVFRGSGRPLCGFQAIASGYYRRVLVLGGEKMTHLSTSATTRILAEVIDKRERQCGATIPALAAMVTESIGKKFACPARAWKTCSAA